jgi:hypothetical protein
MPTFSKNSSFSSSVTAATYDQTDLFRMTSFTKILSQNEASIYTSPDQAISDINPLMYGGFTE